MITIIKDYFFKHNVMGNINYFNNAKDLLRQPIYDVYFLGILIRDMNGIELGKILKQKNEKCEIIYITDQRNYGPQTYEVKAFNYLLKPINIEEINDTLDRLFEKIRSEYRYLRTKDGEERIPLKELLYADIIGRNLTCHFYDGELIQSTTLKKSFEKMIGTLKDNPDFVFVAPSLLINLNYISSMNSNYLTFTTGEILYFPKSAHKLICERWKQYG